MISSYKVLEFFFNHKNEILDSDALMHYLKMIVIVNEMIKLMKEIDEVVRF